MNNLLFTLLLCAAFSAQANTFPMATGHGPVVEIDADENPLRAPELRAVMPANDFCADAIPITPSPAGARCTVSGFTLPFETDGTTDSGVPTVCTEPGLDQWFTWTATTDGLYFSSDDLGDPGIAVFASCADANTGNALDCINPLNSGILSGWSVGDELLIQIYDSPTTLVQDIVFCLEEVTIVTSPTPPVNDLCAGAIPIAPQPSSDGCETPGFLLPFASDGTTDSGVPIPGFVEPGNDQWFTWTATSAVLDFSSKAPGYPGIAIFASCADVDASNEIAERPPLEGSEQLSGWNIGDELIIQIYTLGTSSTSDVAFCLEDPTLASAPPVARCVTTFTADLDADGNIALAPEDLNDGSSDDETPTGDLGLALDFGGPIPTCDQLGLTITVTLIVTDGDGLSSTCTSQVRVRDNTAPEATCQNVAVELDDNGRFRIFTGFIRDVVLTDFVDNCVASPTSAAISGGSQTFACDDLGVATRTFISRDGNGQEDRCSGVRLQINDPLGVCNEAPVANCQPVTEVVADASVPFTVNANDFDNGSTDDDGVYSLVFNPETDRQENSVRDCDITGEGLGMTFRPGQTGVIQSIRVRSGTAISTNLHIYGGNQGSGIPGEVGNPDYSQPAELFFGQYDDAANLTTILLDEPFPVVAGQAYSFILEGETTLSRNCDGTPNNPGGRTLNNFADKDLNSTQDLTFQVNVIGETTREFSGIGTFPVTVFAVDEQGNVSEGCTTTFTLNQERPVANCQPTAVAQVDAEGNVQLDPNDLDDGSTNGDGSTDGLVFSTDFITDGLGCNDTGGDATVVTLTVTNQAGLSATCTSLVTVEDNIGPTVTCRDTTLALDPLTGELDVLAFSRVVPFTATDNCAITDTSFQFSIGTTYDCDIFRNGGEIIGPVISVPGLSIRIRDASDNQGSCFVRITLTDPGLACDDAPVARCVETLTVELDEDGNSNLSPADLNAGSTDTETPAGDLVFSFDPTEGDVDCEDIGTGLVSLIVTDNVGKTDTCFTQTTVEDNLPPEATCQNVAVELNGSGRFNFFLGFALNVILTDFVDNCAAVPASATITGQTQSNCNDLGVITRTFFYRDGNGQEDRCAGVRLQVTDPLGVCGEDPVVNCFNVSTVTVDDLADTPALINANDFDNGSTDDGSVYTLVYSGETDRQENTAFDCSSTGFDQGQTFTAGQTGVIQSIEVRSGASMNTELHLYNGNLANDPAVDPSAPDYTQDVELFFGLHSNQANLSVMTLDEPFPVVAGQEYTFVLDLETTLSRSCAVSAAYADGQPITGLTPQDDPGGQDFTFEVNIIGPTTQEFDSIGTFPVTVFAVDDQGNVSEGCETIVRVGQLTPIARCSTSVVAQLDENGAVILSPSDLDSLSLTGNPPAVILETLTFSFGSDISSLNCNAARDRTVIPVTLEVTRANGRSDSCVSMVTVQDTIAPVLVCREELVVPIDPETGIARFRSADAVISNVDNCGIRTLSSSGSPNFGCGDIGRIIPITVRTSDQSSNLSTCEVTVTITDPENFCPANTAPVANCRSELTLTVRPDGTVPFTPLFLNDGSFDAETSNGNLELTAVLNGDPFSCADVGLTRMVDLIVTDPLGLADTCTSAVTVVDPDFVCDDAPVAVCLPTLTIALDQDGTFAATELDNGSTDLETPVADLIFSFAGEIPDCGAVGNGAQEVGLVVTDNVGQTDTCFTQVAVEDNIDPEVTCQNVIFELRRNGRFVLALDDILNSILTDFNDNCAELNTSSVVVSGGTSFACEAIGEVAKSFTFENSNEQESECDVTLAITDPLGVCGEDPIANCAPFTVTNPIGPTVTLNANVFDDGSSDDRSIYALVYSDATDRQDNTTFDCSTTGFNQGQTFTAGQTGVIQSIKVRAGASTNTTLFVRSGGVFADTAGQHIQNVELFFGEHSGQANLTVITLDRPFPVVAGQEYSFNLSGETTLSRSCPGSDAYAGGRPTQGFNFFSGSGDEDLTFEVNIIGPTEMEFPTEGGTLVTVFAVDDQGNVSEGCETFINPDQPLPVEWLSFGAHAGAKTVELQWETTEEPDNAGFHVERSATGNNWVSIGEVAARIGAHQRYAFTDNAPLQGTSYYRLRQTDYDGPVSYSPVETVVFFADDRVVLSPNPATDIISVQLPNGAELLGLLDVAGRATSVRFSDQHGTLKANISRLPAGLYFLRVILADGQPVARRLIVR